MLFGGRGGGTSVPGSEPNCAWASIIELEGLAGLGGASSLGGESGRKGNLDVGGNMRGLIGGGASHIDRLWCFMVLLLGFERLLWVDVFLLGKGGC